MNEQHTQPDSDDSLPVEVVAALKTRYGPSGRMPGPVPESRDHHILADARRHLAATVPTLVNVRRSHRVARRWTVLAAGTVLTLLLLIAVLPRDARQPTRLAGTAADHTRAAAGRRLAVNELKLAEQAEGLAFDVDGNGRVNILDAFLVARRLESGTAPEAGQDVDQDGRLTQSDVDLIAMNAVRL